ncbi:MAG: 16S rRNA (uracil(1498)-N(3))-methyltransferase [Bacteroides sp.]|nr:16S rRNA (uracil(1498)-N(3))-methyltransferase [Bacteroides sp.]MCM1412753.1 16S rRNA (uracil(1498)-N(3))-methyltransferase [Bacteroides sp.]MCM1470953.1 16S rRNA (uracil(1498)-N(3))-methyltransferase [Bacteroides sp.]
MIQFYAPDIESTLTLPQSDSQHAVRVLRIAAGDNIEVIDGRGHRFTCVMVDPHPKHAAVEIITKIDMPLSWRQQIVAAVAPTKHMDRMEWMVEKLTEIGVNRIIPLLCRRSERKEIKTERLEKIAVSAMKQSLKSVLPIVSPMTPLPQVATQFPALQKFVAYCDANTERVDLAKAYRAFADACILIGPEGDFAPEEISMLLDNGWQPVTLGDNRLRTETAALTAVDTFHIIDQLNQ